MKNELYDDCGFFINLTKGCDRKIINEMLSNNFISQNRLDDILNNFEEGAISLKTFLDKLSEDKVVSFFNILSEHSKIILATSKVNEIVSLVPFPQFFSHIERDINLNRNYVLSSFTYIQRDDNGNYFLESPKSFCRLILHNSSILQLIESFSDSKRRESNNYSEVELIILTFLILGKFVNPINAFEDDADGMERILRQWEFHDLLFHSRSRLGRNGSAIGGNYRFKGKILPQPAFKQIEGIHKIPLLKPNLELISLYDPSLISVIEHRRSVRKQGQIPISFVELSEFLFRVGRVRSTYSVEGIDFTSRPYPSGGASYELEIYLTINACNGVERGFYYYQPLDHSLIFLSPPNNDLEGLLDEAWMASAMSCRPQILITIASRFQRVSWKYQGIAYATTLKNVGVIYSTMYLVATAMNLAPCALGLGNSDRFSKLAGTNYYEESSVGEFMLGSV